MVSPVPPVPQPLAGLSRDQLVAASAGWLAAYLNLHGMGLGYIYQRRWGAFWIGGAAAVGASVLLAGASALLVNNLAPAQRPQSPEEQNLWVGGAAALGGYAGVFAVGVGSAVEAGLAVNRARRRLQSPAGI